MSKLLRSKAARARTVVASPKAPRASSPRGGRRKKKSEVDIAISTVLAPAAAIAVLDNTERLPDSPAPALEVLGAGVSEATDSGKVRVQLVFDSGAVLPVEMSTAAGKALEEGLAGDRRGKTEK